MYWVPKELLQIYTDIAYICIGKVRDLQYLFAVICEHVVSIDMIMYTERQTAISFKSLFAKHHMLCVLQ